jgi:hypothetical protein
VTIAPYLLLVTAYAMWWGGWSAPGRFVVPVLLLMAVPAAVFWNEPPEESPLRDARGFEAARNREAAEEDDEPFEQKMMRLVAELRAQQGDRPQTDSAVLIREDRDR